MDEVVFLPFGTVFGDWVCFVVVNGDLRCTQFIEINVCWVGRVLEGLRYIFFCDSTVILL